MKQTARDWARFFRRAIANDARIADFAVNSNVGPHIVCGGTLGPAVRCRPAPTKSRVIKTQNWTTQVAAGKGSNYHSKTQLVHAFPTSERATADRRDAAAG